MNKKLHKSIRQYAKFDLKKLDTLIDINSYELLESYVDMDTLYIMRMSKFNLNNILNVNIKCNKLTIYKHKTNNVYMLYEKCIDTQSFNEYYFYFKYENNHMKLDRKKKPSFIFINKNIAETTINSIRMMYHKNNVIHNEYGPADISYYYDNGHYLLDEINFKRNGKHYNKNGLVHYTDLAYSLVSSLTFMKNNIVTILEYHCEGPIDITRIFPDEKKFSAHYHHNFDNDDFIVEYAYFKKEQYHRLNGPAIIKKRNNIIDKQWHINNKQLPSDIISYEKGKEKYITKTDILKAMLFDLEYGEFLKKVFDNAQKI